MNERVYPSGKPNGTAPPKSTVNNHAPPPSHFPPIKSQQYNNPTRHPYRPNPAPTRAERSNRRCTCRRCFCRCCFWSILIFLIILLFAAIAGAIFYVLYKPHQPTFSITSLKISQFNLTTAPADETTRLSTKLNFTLTTHNPNKKITYFYDPVSINLFSNDAHLANGSFSNFTSSPQETHPLHSTLGIVSELIETTPANLMKSDLKKKTGLPIRVEMETNVRVKVEKFKSKKVGIKVTCDGIHTIVPKDKNSSTSASADNAHCKVNLQIKIWKFNF